MLPILIVQDWVSVWAFRRDYSLRNLVILTPSAVIGVAARLAACGAGQRGRRASGDRRDLDRFRRPHADPGPAGTRSGREAGGPKRRLMGFASGFTSFISHAGAPPFQVYVMPQYLEPRIFAGTATIFFAAVNLFKLPGYFFLGQLSPRQPRCVGLAASGCGSIDFRRRLAGPTGVPRPVLCHHSRAYLPYRSKLTYDAVLALA